MCFACFEATREINIPGAPCAYMNNVRDQNCINMQNYAKYYAINASCIKYYS